MNDGALRALEWEQIVEIVAGFALTPPGAAQLAELEPQFDAHRVAQLLAATTEGVKYLDANPPFALQAPDDLEALVAALTVEGRALEAQRLVAFANFLDSVGNTCATIRRVSGPYPTLKNIADGFVSFSSQIAEVRRQIDPAGEVNDSASPELGRLRTQIRKQR